VRIRQLPALFFCNNLNMFAGEQQQALRVLTLCGKGRSGAVASEEAWRT
jgi:hypothetical protein